MNDLQKFYKNKRVLITGHTGFKGSWLSQVLVNWGAEVSGLSLKPNTTPNLFTALELKNKINNYFVDIRDYQKVKNVINRVNPQIIFHLAAQPLVRESYDQPLNTFATNILGTVNVLEAIRENGKVKVGVIITTDKVYKNNESGRSFKEDDPLAGYDPYSASKASAELVIDSYIKSFFNPQNYLKSHRTLIASVRAGNVIGGGDWGKDRLVTDFIKGVCANKKLIIRNPEAVRPWQFVLEPLNGYLLLAKKLYGEEKEFSGAWNFGSNSNNQLKVKEFVELAIKILNKGTYVIKRDFGKHEALILKLNCQKAKKNLSWRQVLNINETLGLTFEWYKDYYNHKDVINITNQQIELFFKSI